jgi:hypothetical protein
MVSISLHVWRAEDLAAGTHVGTIAAPDGLAYDEDAGCRSYTDPFGDGSARSYTWTSWLSPEVRPGHAFTDLVPSWNARTPDGSWIEVEARTSEDGLHWSRWWVLGRWAETDTAIHPTTVRGQDDGTARVHVEELVAADDRCWQAYQLRVTLLRPADSDARPTLSLLSAVVSGALAADPAAGSPGRPGGTGRGCEVAVPAYSQQLHRGEYPQWASGGESWCSPTSIAMVLGTWGLGPTPEEYAWVEPGYRDRFVDHAVRFTFDHAYHGAGNWSFNTAYAALYGTEAYVTRLRDLGEAEEYVAAGIPLVASVAFEEHELPTAGYRTSGHLLVLVGFDEHGDVIVNDPASHTIPSNDEVRTVYPRAAFEKAWMRSRGLVYVIHPPSVPLPDDRRSARVVEPVETTTERVVEPVETSPTTR